MFEGGEEWLQTSLDGYYRNLALMEEKEINLLSEDAIYNGMLGALTAGLFETPGMLGVQGNTNTPISAKPFNTYQFQTADIKNQPISANAFLAMGQRNNVNKSTVLNSNDGNDIIVSNHQFGRKIGKHTKEYGLNPGSENDRNTMAFIINDILTNPDEIAIGDSWRFQKGTILYYIKGEDVVVVRQEDMEFITILKGGITNERVKNARKQKI